MITNGDALFLKFDVMCVSLLTKTCICKIAGQVWEESLTLIYGYTIHCSIHNIDPPYILSSVPWPTSEHGVNFRYVLTWACGSISRCIYSLYKLWASVWYEQTVAHLTALAHTGYKRLRIAGSSVPPPAELCLQWNQRIILTMRAFIQTFTICLALSLCLADSTWVLFAVHFRASFAVQLTYVNLSFFAIS